MNAQQLGPVVLLALALSIASADSSADPNAKPSASASARVEIPKWPDKSGLPAFDAEPFPEEKSKTPTQDEWRTAPEVRLSQVADIAAACRAYRFREWMKIHCERKTAGLRLIAGSTDGIALFVANGIGTPEANPGFWESMGRFGQIIFPVRRGDRRVFEWMDFDFGFYEGWGIDSTFLVEESWIGGAASPEIALRVR